jgi:hypothetical protein
MELNKKWRAAALEDLAKKWVTLSALISMASKLQ